MKPANYYATSVTIPDYVEDAIASLSLSDRLTFTADLLKAMKGHDVFLANTRESIWLQQQPYDSLLSVLKWVTSELI